MIKGRRVSPIQQTRSATAVCINNFTEEDYYHTDSRTSIKVVTENKFHKFRGLLDGGVSLKCKHNQTSTSLYKCCHKSGPQVVYI